jgi:HSP20 family protein
MQQLYDSIARRAFEIFDGNGRWFGNDLSNWLQAESEVLHPMHLEIAESDNAFAVTAEAPGFAAKEIDVEVDGKRLTISGKHESREETMKGKMIYSERRAQEVFRSIHLPAEIDSSKVTAVLKDGVLSIELPKAANTKIQRIETKAEN